jgi:hypothetical protein
MTSLKQLKQGQKMAHQQKAIISELNHMVEDIDRCEKNILSLQKDLEAVNLKFQGPRTTRQDIDFLTGLLDCAKRKLAWEKQMTSLQKRTPEILGRISQLANDPVNPPDDQTRVAMLNALQAIQVAMERLQKAKSSAF